ncbi:hypothetical protein RZA67_13250 [Stenotrophomonas sp. C3(2023)]|uniref:hypothetical protein n=1 Tax=Stenotrophomonas sp. C3(2023) TaxID=3080277 RepID=UPI00293C3955|nr:hypothetical protein [Stenotrophomonas sp. C3(2023)]MDV3469684.1 hypothetical protein [Stenotrophomonas sp. C3(2023)]
MLPLNRRSLFTLAYVCAFLSSKFMGLTVGYALDDYAVSHPGAEGLAAFFISQGRYTNAALDALLHASQLNMTSFSVVAFLATLIFSALFYLEVFNPRTPARPSIVVAMAALLGAHSYYTEYVTFRQSALPMSVMFGMLFFAARQYRLAWAGDRRVLRLTGALLAALVAMGANQLALCFAAIGLLYMHLSATVELPGHASFPEQAKSVGKAIALTGIAGAALSIGNLLLAKVIRLLAGVESDGRAALVAFDQLPERAHQLLDLMPTLLIKAEPIASTPAKALLMLAVLTVLLPLSSPRRRTVLVALGFAICSWGIALLPHAVTGAWWPVPRTLVAIPMVIAGTLGLSTGLGRVQAGVAAALTLAAAVLFCAHSNAMLTNQQRVNRWDIAQAQEIAYRVAERYPESYSKLAVVGGTWAYPVAPLAAQGDMNLSAFSIGWAIDPLFDEATGTDMTVRVAPELAEMCASRPKFPAPEATIESGGEIVVCL